MFVYRCPTRVIPSLHVQPATTAFGLEPLSALMLLPVLIKRRRGRWTSPFSCKHSQVTLSPLCEGKMIQCEASFHLHVLIHTRRAYAVRNAHSTSSGRVRERTGRNQSLNPENKEEKSTARSIKETKETHIHEKASNANTQETTFQEIGRTPVDSSPIASNAPVDRSMLLAAQPGQSSAMMMVTDFPFEVLVISTCLEGEMEGFSQ